MAKAPKTITLAPADNLVLAALSAAGENGIMVPQTASKNVVAAGYAETNPAMTDANGIATRLTAKGKEYMSSFNTVSIADVAALAPTADAASKNVVAAGYAETNPAMTDANGIATRLTTKGEEYMSSLNTAPTADAASKNVVAAATSYAIDSDISLPSIKRSNGRTSLYPFDALNINQSFHSTDEARKLAAAVSNANKRFSAATGEQETVELIDYKLDENGKRVAVDGHFVKLGVKTVTRAKMRKEREFVLRSVDASDPRGPGVRVYRIA